MKTEEQKVIDELFNREERTLHSSPELFEGIRINGHKIPDPKIHKIVSFIKSGVRIIGYSFIPFELSIAAIILILSEAIGIIEETV